MAEIVSGLYRAHGLVLRHGKMVPAGRFIEINLDSMTNPNYMSRAAVERLVNDGIIVTPDGEAVTHDPPAVVTWADVLVVKERDGEVDALNWLMGELDGKELSDEQRADLSAGIANDASGLAHVKQWKAALSAA